MLMSLILQQGPAETTDYMIFGYIVIFGVMLLYIASLYLRRRNLKQDMQLIEELNTEAH
ncbi:MAG: hypothetical protein ACWGO1_15545 [Anaerolineales bacterium]